MDHFYREYKDTVRSAVMGVVGGTTAAHLADDIEQDVWFAVIKSGMRKRYKKERGTMATYVRVFANSRALDSARRYWNGQGKYERRENGN